MSRRLILALLPTFVSAALAQSAPILTGPSGIVYPPIAKAAHVSGDVTVTFSINPDGTTTSVNVVSGPVMLQSFVVDRIRHWTFKTPLPLNAQTDFEAKYSFHLKSEEDADYEDSLDRPPYSLCCGDVIMTKAADGAITGDVRSTNSAQIIDVSATATTAKTKDLCPGDPHKTPPDKTDFNDYVELFRNECPKGGCPDYRVRIYRNGRVTWHGFNDVATLGDSEALMNASAADTLVTRFQDESFWAACSDVMPPDPKPLAAVASNSSGENSEEGSEWQDDTLLTARIGGIVKTVGEHRLNSTPDNSSNTYSWSVDRAADTHRWRHVEASTEPYSNMRNDLLTPKPGMTLLIRATYHFNPYTAQQTFGYLDKLLKRGESVDQADASGWTPLMYASYFDPVHYDAREPDPIKLLLDARADPNRASLHGDTALMFGAYSGTLLQPLLDHGADINAHNADGVTTLMLLAQAGKENTDELKEALAAGADPNAHDNLGRTALDYLSAASCGKAIVPLPVPFMQVILAKPPSCPDTTSASFLAAQALLQKAMAAKATK